MAEEAVTEGLGESLEIEAKPKAGLSGKKLVLFIVLPFLLIVTGGGAGAYVLGFLDPWLGGDGSAVEEEAVSDESIHTPVAFYELPEMLVNLNSSGRKSHFLKISISLELSDEDDVKVLESVMPRIIDNFQVYLRGLRIEDLQCAAGLQRLREELLLRVNAATKGKHVRDVLFKEMLVQ